MEPKDNEQPIDKTPDFVKDKAKVHEFGEKEDETLKQESFPETGNQSQSGAATNNSELEIDPTDDGDDSLAK